MACCAIGLTAVFLVVVLTDIVLKGMPAFTQNNFVLYVQLDPAEIDPQGTKDPPTIRQGDFQALVRNALRAMFPEVTDRTGRRLLDGLLSSGAADRLRDRVVADPQLIGQTVKAPVLLSERADLYYKGIGTAISRRPGRGIATPSGTTGDITILTSSNDFCVRSCHRQASPVGQGARHAARGGQLAAGRARRWRRARPSCSARRRGRPCPTRPCSNPRSSRFRRKSRGCR